MEGSYTSYDSRTGSDFIKSLCALAKEGKEIEAIRRELVEAGQEKPCELKNPGKQDENQSFTFDIPTPSHNTLRKKLFLSKAVKKKENKKEDKFLHPPGPLHYKSCPDLTKKQK